MKKITSIFILVALLISSAATASGVEIDDQWVREAPPGMQMLAGYMTIENKSKKDVVLTGASSSAFGSIELHHTVIKNGMASMTQQESITIPANSEFEFKPKSYHLMLMKPKKQLKAGDKVKIKLKFSNYRSVSAKFPVRKSVGGMHHQHHHHK